MESSAPSALYRLLCQAQKLGTTFGTRPADSHPDRWRLLRCSILYETTENTVSDPARPLPDILLWLKDDTQASSKISSLIIPGGEGEQRSEL